MIAGQRCVFKYLSGPSVADVFLSQKYMMKPTTCKKKCCNDL